MSEKPSLQKKLEQRKQYFEREDIIFSINYKDGRIDQIDETLKVVRSCASFILILIDDEITDLIVKTVDAGIAVKRQDLWETKDFLLDKVRKKLLVSKEDIEK